MSDEYFTKEAEKRWEEIQDKFTKANADINGELSDKAKNKLKDEWDIFCRKNLKKVKILSKAELIEKLKKLPQLPQPESLSAGAMCYSPGVPSGEVKFICTTCWHQTVYVAAKNKRDFERKSKRLEKQRRKWQTVMNTAYRHGGEYLYNISQIIYEIDAIRETLRYFPWLDLTLDANEFCMNCSPTVTEPQLKMIINFPDAPAITISNFNQNDYELLKDLCYDRNKHINGCETETPLVEHLEYLKQLLGIGDDEL